MQIKRNGGYYALKGFEFQIDKTIIELFNANDTTPIYLEQIQDIDSDNFVIQVKYKETQKYIPSKIKEPIIQLLDEYKKKPSKRYYLYCFFNDVNESKKTLSISKIDKILGSKKNNFTKTLKNKFISNFELHFSKTFQEQFSQAVKLIKTNAGCTDFDEALIYYGSITNYLRKLVVNSTTIQNRTCTKSEILRMITGNRKIVFDSAYRIYKGKQRYIAGLRKQYFTFRNIDNWERFFIVELSGDESIATIKSIVLKIKNKFYKKMTKTIKSGAPYIHITNITDDALKKIKSELSSEGHIIKDGYDYMNADFNIQSLKMKSTINNNISIKFLNKVENLQKMIVSELNCAKKIYQFYMENKIDIDCDVEQINIKIESLSEIQQIFK